MQKIKSVRDADVSGKRVLLRVDFNVPLDTSSGQAVITDDTRIKAALPTIELLAEKGAKISILTHLGRPEGKVVENLRTAPLSRRLSELLPGVEVTMLENVRFDPGEEANDEAFAKKLAEGEDMFVNDAFAASHRAHASIVGVAKLLPSYAGLLMEKEIEKLSEALAPIKPSLAIVGGAKLETKAPLIEKLAKIYEKVLIGGNIANQYKSTRANVFLPEDGLPQLEGMFDIGPKTKAAWVGEVKEARFVLWNGPVGWFEKGYGEATYALAQALVDSGVGAVIGGGDTAAAVVKFPFDPEKVFISTGGGATLEFLAHGTLPGIEVLR
ncbi:MAG: phosphoglycerate kinase [Parcubacteria group bacterium Gr01-1014_56]|nr:MAG: phosphoglycerate kinase [Parcubacteria group bacterium Gr01-1014_56]